MDVDTLDDGERLELLHELELMSRTISAIAVRVQVGFYASQVASQVEQGVAPSRAGKAVPDDLAVARMTSPYWGSRHLTSAKALVTEMPRTLTALAEGVIDDFQARSVTETTACLSPADRDEVDRRLADVLPGASTREIVARARALVYEVDPLGFVERARRAAKNRGVTIRPCPDVMGLLSARLPAPQAIACYAALRKHAEALRAGGDPRSLQQLMADELYSRLTGRAVVDGVDVEVGLVITDAALFGGTSDTANLTGYGPIPAETARALLRPRDERAAQGQTDQGSATPSSGGDPQACPAGGRCTDFACEMLHGLPPTTTGSRPAGSGDAPVSTTSVPEPSSPQGKAAQVWLRRLFTDPATGRLLTRDSRRRLFTGALRALVIARDQTCRNLWCGAPIRHVDHVQRFADDGTTAADNGQGLCARCNLAREHPRLLRPRPENYRSPPPLLPVLIRAG